MLSALQAEIVKDTDADGQDAGSIRERQVFIGAKDRRLADARFDPAATRRPASGWNGALGRVADCVDAEI